MMRPNIKISNLNKRFRLNTGFIKKIIKKILTSLKRPRADIELEVIFLGDGAIEALNRRYRKRDRPTDVLAFKINLSEFRSKGFLGEIFISSDTAFKNSKVFDTSFEEELVLYMIHALLHLFGYNDGRREDRLEMSKRERAMLDYLWETEDLSKVSMRR